MRGPDQFGYSETCASRLPDSAKQGLERHRGAFGSLPRGPAAAGASPRRTGNVGAVISVRPVTEDEHLAFLRGRSSASFLQTPAWGRVKADWRRQSRRLVRRRQTTSWSARRWCSTATCRGCGAAWPTCPRGPCSTGTSTTSRPGSTALADHAKSEGAFAVRIGPPVVTAPLERGAAQGGHRRPRRTPPGRPGADRPRRHRGRRRLPAARARLAGAGRRRTASPPVSRATTSTCRSSTTTASR